MVDEPVARTTLTFLFTDIEGHSALWDSYPESMTVALREHDDLIAAAVAEAGGSVVKNGGDGAMAVFDEAGRGVDATIALQRSLSAREWPDVGKLKVRMGLHVGVADARDGDYFGPDVIPRLACVPPLTAARSSRPEPWWSLALVAHGEAWVPTASGASPPRSRSTRFSLTGSASGSRRCGPSTRTRTRCLASTPRSSDATTRSPRSASSFARTDW